MKFAYTNIFKQESVRSNFFLLLFTRDPLLFLYTTFKKRISTLFLR